MYNLTMVPDILHLRLTNPRTTCQKCLRLCYTMIITTPACFFILWSLFIFNDAAVGHNIPVDKTDQQVNEHLAEGESSRAQRALKSVPYYQDNYNYTSDSYNDEYNDDSYKDDYVDDINVSVMNKDYVPYSTKYGTSDLKYHQKTSQKLPKAIIIGVKKCGTRAVLEYLRLHPKVRATGPEPHFFDKYYSQGLDWYRSIMPPTTNDQMTIEKTPSYFVTKEVPRRIYNMSRDIKLIIVVRNPVVRAISDYTQTATKYPHLKTFEDMVFLDNNTRTINTAWVVLKKGVYTRYLEHWMQYFPLRQMLFVNGERLVADPAGEMDRVQDFLGLERFITKKHFFLNANRGFPCLVKHENADPHCLDKNKARRHPHVEEQVLERLRDFYRPFNLKFYQIVGEDFQWS